MVGFCSCSNATQKSWEWELNHKAQFSISTAHPWMRLQIREAEIWFLCRVAWLSPSWQAEEFSKDVDQEVLTERLHRKPFSSLEHLDISQKALEPDGWVSGWIVSWLVRSICSFSPWSLLLVSLDTSSDELSSWNMVSGLQPPQSRHR